MATGKRRATGITRRRAIAIARARLAQSVIACDISEEPPRDIYWPARTVPRNCWYVIAGAHHPHMLDGTPRHLYCISKCSGRIILATPCHAG